MKYRFSAAYASITAAFFLGVAGCSSGGEGEPAPPSESMVVTASADLRAAAKHWNGLSGPEQNAICERALQTSGPDYKGMLSALMDTGIPEEDASSMLPFAVNECL